MSSQNALKQLDNMHKILYTKFQKTKNLNDFKDLEEFLQFIVFDNKDIINNIKNPFAKFANTALKEELRKSSYIKNLYQNLGDNGITSAELGKYGEEGLSYLLIQAISILENNKLLQDNDDLNNIFQKIIIGQEQATMLSKSLLKKITNEVSKEGEKNLNNFSNLWNKYGTFALRQGKIDVNMARLQLDVYTTPLAKKINSLKVTVKNYSNNIVHLEKVSLLKAYQGYHYAVTRKRNTKNLNQLYNKVFLPQIKDINILQHFTHIVNIYALTGMGQSYIDKANLSMIESKLGADTIAVFQRKNKKVYILPTSDIASLSLASVAIGPNKETGFRYGDKGELKTPQLIDNKTIDVSLNIYQAHRQIYKNLTS